MSRNPRQNREQGGALLLVLWMSAALAALALSVATTVRTEVEHTSTMADGLRAQYLASGSVERFLQWMEWGPRPNLDGTIDFWDRRRTLFPMPYATGDVVVETIPETGKMNVNNASPQDLYTLLVALTRDPARAEAVTEAILDWRARGPEALGAYYKGLGPTFQPRHASLEEIEELLFVRGVTPELYYGSYIEDAQGRLYARGGLRDCLSVWGSQFAYDVNGASPALLEVTGLSQAQVGLIVARRTAQPFTNLVELRDLGIPLGRLTVNETSMWTIRATARLRRPDGQPSDVVRSSAAVVKVWTDRKQRPSPVEVLRYYNDAWSEFAIKPPVNPGGFLQGGLAQ